MPKRKREDDASEQDSQIEDQAIRIKVSRLRAKLDQALKSLTPALKLARGFERQKLGRRQKTANNEPHTLLRLREEVIILKQLQLGPTAKNYLFKQLSRTKRIAESPPFIHIYSKEPSVESAKSGAEANVLGRLFNAAPVKEALDEIMKTIFGVLGIPQIRDTNGNREPKVKAKGAGDEQINLEQEDDEFHGFSSAESLSEVQIDRERSLLDTTEHHEIETMFKNRIATSDDSEELSDEENHERRSMSISSEDYEEDQLSTPKARTSAKSRSVIDTSKTAFLPSLSMGGYYSGSESGGDDDFDRAPPVLEVRKNRRGQRARQQLAEKKFGQKAKHLQKQMAGNARSSGWDAKRGAVAPRGGQVQRTGQSRPMGRYSQSQPAGPDRAKQEKPKTRDDQGSLHPSWEAAKKKKMQDQAPTKFAGKKITFD